MGEHGGVSRRAFIGAVVAAAAAANAPWRADGGRPAAHRSARSARRTCSRSASRPATRCPTRSSCGPGSSQIRWRTLDAAGDHPRVVGGRDGRGVHRRRRLGGCRSSTPRSLTRSTSTPRASSRTRGTGTGSASAIAVSPVGRTRTAPADGRRGRAAAIRLRVVPELPERPLHPVRAPRRRGPRPRAVPR